VRAVPIPFASLLPYAQPTSLIEIVDSTVAEGDNGGLARRMRALQLHLRICREHAITAAEQPGACPTVAQVLGILFPGCDIAAWQSPRRCSPLIRELMTTSKMPQADAAPCLAHAFAAHITRLLTTAVAPQPI
jgi:hypothetical protein